MSVVHLKRLLALAVCTGAAMAMSAVPAIAAPGNGAATPFKASYDNYIFGVFDFHADCSGAHIVHKHGAVKGTVEDSEECTLSDVAVPLVAGTYSGSPLGFVPGVGYTTWNSDYPPANDQQATSWTVTLSPNGDGTWHQDVVAYY